MATEAEIREESRNVRQLQIVVGLVMNVLWQDDSLTIEEARELVRDTRRFALKHFPDKELAYDLIYAPRFRRVLAEKYTTL